MILIWLCKLLDINYNKIITKEYFQLPIIVIIIATIIFTILYKAINFKPPTSYPY